jgi:hypothetical protein
MALAACDTPTGPTTRLNPTKLGSPNAAVVLNERIETTAFAVSTCSGEPIVGEVDFHEVIGITDASSGNFHLKEHLNINGQGTAPTSGTDYTISETINIEENLAAGAEETETEHLNLISKGSAPNEVVQFVFHITVTPDGDVTSTVDNFFIKCTG